MTYKMLKSSLNINTVYKLSENVIKYKNDGKNNDLRTQS